jgi:hypothetical protein
MKQQGHQNTNIILGVGAGLVLLLGALAFLFVLNLGPSVPGEETQQAAMQGPARHDSLPATPSRDFKAHPMTVEDKREMAPQIAASLGVLGEGWHMRPFSHRDVRALRTDLIDCPVGQDDAAHCASIYTGDGKGMWVYAKGDQMIAVGLTYERSRRALPKGSIRLRKVFDDAYKDVFERGVTKAGWRGISPHAGFDLSILDAPRTQEGPAITLQRLHAQLKGDGVVNVFIAANTDRATALRVLDALDSTFTRAMVAPAALTREDAIASLSERSKKFEVLSEDALRAKVKKMSRKQRNSFAMGLMKDALAKGNTPLDYKVSYQAMGEAGHADTIAYLMGTIGQDHPGYRALRIENNKRLPIGACVVTRAGLYCETAAQTMRIVQEIRRRTGADEKAPSN